MARIKCSVADLTVPQKLIKGAEFINLGTGNVNVPNNAPLIAALTAAQAELQAAEEAVAAARSISKQRTAERDAALAAWTVAVTNLATYTQTATGGDPGKMMSAGFGVCNPPLPPPPSMLTAPTGVTVSLNGTPGNSKITWNGVVGADGFVVQGSPDPDDETKWTMPIISRKTSCELGGATAGQPYWFRIAAFDDKNQGPWSMPAERPVM